MMDKMIRAVDLATKYGLSDKVLRGHLRKEWPWQRKLNDFWTFPADSEQAEKMEAVAKRLAES